MKSILFVDDEKQVLDSLRRMLHARRREWKMAFVDSGAKALELLKAQPFDVLVTDMRMPGMDGVELLNQVRTKYPRMIRIVLSGYSEREKILRSVRPAHQYLAKPVGQEQLLAVLQSALQLQSVLANPHLVRILTSAEALPPVPTAYAQLMEELQKEDSSMERVGRIVEQDKGMAATLLKVVNSAFFGLPRHISSTSQAVGMLGLDIVSSLVLSYELFNTFEVAKPFHFSFEGLWRHSTVVGAFAKKIAQLEGMDQNAADEAFMAGNLHDVGKLPLYHYEPDKYRMVIEHVRLGAGTIGEVEQLVLETSHAEAGAFLLGLWGMSERVVRAIAFHHRPGSWQPERMGLHTIVHAANILEHELYVVHDDYKRPPLDMKHLKAVGAAKRIADWRAACSQLLKDGEAVV